MFIRGKHTTAVSVGEVIKDLLDAKGWTTKDLALRMGYSEIHTARIMNGNVRVSNKTAEKLESIFSISAKSWIKFDARFVKDRLKILAN